MDGPLWESTELNHKQSMDQDEYQGLPQTLYDSRSGKELANYGPFAGVS